MSTTEIIGKHDVLCSSLNFATPEGAAKCDCSLSVMADMLEALEELHKAADEMWTAIGNSSRAEMCGIKQQFHVLADATEKAETAIAKAKGGAA